MFSNDALDAAALITGQVATNRMLDGWNDLRQAKREAATGNYLQAGWSESHRQLCDLTDRFNRLVALYNELLVAYQAGQKQISAQQMEIERQRAQMAEDRYANECLRELADALRGEIRRLDPGTDL